MATPALAICVYVVAESDVCAILFYNNVFESFSREISPIPHILTS